MRSYKNFFYKKTKRSNFFFTSILTKYISVVLEILYKLNFSHTRRLLSIQNFNFVRFEWSVSVYEDDQIFRKHGKAFKSLNYTII